MRPPAPACSSRGAQLPAAWPPFLCELTRMSRICRFHCFPLLAAEVVHDLRAVVPVVDVRRAFVGQVVVDAATARRGQAGPVLRPAEIHAAEQGLGGHHGRGAAAALIGVERAVAAADAVEIEVGQLPGFVGHGEVRGPGRLAGP